MGFTKAAAESALAQSNNDVRGAVDLLIGGASVGSFAAAQASAIPKPQLTATPVPTPAPAPRAAARTTYEYNPDPMAPAAVAAPVPAQGGPVFVATASAVPVNAVGQSYGARGVGGAGAAQFAQQQPVQGITRGTSRNGGQRLAEGWEERRDARSGRFYYVNHHTKSTSWSHPGWMR
jgi:hypothetical protein